MAETSPSALLLLTIIPYWGGSLGVAGLLGGTTNPVTLSPQLELQAKSAPCRLMATAKNTPKHTTKEREGKRASTTQKEGSFHLTHSKPRVVTQYWDYHLLPKFSLCFASLGCRDDSEMPRQTVYTVWKPWCQGHPPNPATLPVSAVWADYIVSLGYNIICPIPPPESPLLLMFSHQ